ncbi:MAG: hypothetical protein EXQ52_08315 [Bryobacterales bacterium]|nr:hypothetical protein [Bryobacterales bacterium]
MRRRQFLSASLAVPLAYAAESGTATVRGKLTQLEGKAPALETQEHKFIPLGGDLATLGVLQDKRLAGVDLEALGEPSPGGAFQVGPIHTKAMFVHKDGSRLLITYWCDLCSIRTYTPGVCWCCQEETAVDLRKPEAE